MSAKKSTVERWVADKSLNGENWLRFEYDEGNNVTKLWCEVCKVNKERICGVKNFSDKYTDGTANIKRDMVKKHACSNQHCLAIRLQHGTSGNVNALAQKLNSDSNIIQAFQKQQDSVHEGIKKLIQISYFVAKEELPFTVYPKLIQLEKLHGVKFGDGYTHDKACSEFIDCIEESTLSELEKLVSMSNYFSILVDGSTDSSTIERESVFLADGSSQMHFLSLEKSVSCDAAGIVDSLERALRRIGMSADDWKKKLIGLGCDGASVNLGVRNGVVARLRAAGVHWLVGVHCFNHRLELAIKDALNKTFFNEITSILDFLYHLYQNSPKKLRELRELGEILDHAASKPGKCYGSCWVGHKLSALKKLQNCYSVYVAHLEQLIEDPSSTSPAADKAKFKGQLTKMKRYIFVYYIHLFLDILSPINGLSLVLPQKRANIITTMAAVENLYEKLDSIALDLEQEQVELEAPSDSQPTAGSDTTDHIYTTTYLRSFQVNFKPEDLSGPKHTPAPVQSIVQNVKTCIQDRFSREVMQGSVLTNGSVVLNVKAWPVRSEAFRIFGNDSIVSLVKHFKTPLDHALENATVEEISEEFQILKYLVRDKYEALLNGAKDVTEFWRQMLTCYEIRLLCNKVLHLFEILLILPISNSSVERMFSTMNRIATDVRNSLGEQRLSSLIRISDEGCGVDVFNCEPAFRVWIGKRNRRLSDID